MEHGAINFVEIPVTDLKRAADFYAGMFGWSFEAEPGARTWLFSTGTSGAMGAITTTRRPSSEGMHLCVTVSDLGHVLAKAGRLGGSIEAERASGDGTLGEFAAVRDNDGNFVGLFQSRLGRHQPPQVAHDDASGSGEA
jgi:predicted enzyme related to lactoylglutathione lyase